MPAFATGSGLEARHGDYKGQAFRPSMDPSVPALAFSPRSDVCLRVGCNHPLVGSRRSGHFSHGAGPCKVSTCTCPSFVGEGRIAAPVHPVNVRLMFGNGVEA